ncbi:MAG: hypothetical protein MJZ37_00885 [Bacilli bacterium]|nr:hypothetical protein [Bacilli bacterium]
MTDKEKEKCKKENAELKKEISVLLSCSNCPENKGGYVCEKEYNDKCLAQKIEYIKELKEENARLSKMLEMAMKDALSQSHYAECNGSVYGLNCSSIDEYRAKLEKRVEETK